MTPTLPPTPISGSNIPPIVFFGTEEFSLITLTALIESGWPIAAIVTKPDTPQGRGQTLTAPRVKSLALQHHLPVWQPVSMSDIAHDLTLLNNPVGVLVSYGKIIPQAIIDLFTPGIINLHPSLLPQYRGPTPIESAILHGNTMTGISLMQLSRKMDAGPVYHQTTYPLRGTETLPELSLALAALGTRQLISLLPSIIDGSLRPTPQDETLATYCPLTKKSDGIIDWQKSAIQLEREVRAYQGWPGSRTSLAGIDVIITTASTNPLHHGLPGHMEVVEHNDRPALAVTTGNGALIVTALKPLGKKEMPVQAFLAGYRSKLGL